MHPDYPSRTLMLMSAGNPGVLDFQDAVEGPYTYDLVSLLKDCYVTWPADKVREWALQFYAELDIAAREHSDADTFLKQFELMGVQRHIKAAGIFARLNLRDGKPGYLKDIPRTVAYIVELGERYPELAFVIELIEQQVLPKLEAAV